MGKITFASNRVSLL